ncbi:MAG TPA: cation:proton antiporter, partial [Rhodopila sp.]
MEPHSLDTSAYKEALVVLGAAGIVIPLFHRLRVSPVLGFMLVGIVVGPFGLASLAPRLPWLSVITIPDPESITPIADLGVALLLFMIGLELSFERLWLMRRLVFGLGCVQVVLCAGVLAAAAGALGYGWHTAVVIGLALAMSSTAVVIQVLAGESRLNTPTGRTAFAILLFQDLAVVPVLFAVGALGSANDGLTARGIGLAIGQAALAVAVIVAVGRLVLRPLFRSVAHTRSAELFIAACLLVVIATGLATAAAGLSMPLGALIGGLLLAGTEYRRQVEVTIEPFKGLFLGVFLISVGMSLDIRTVGHHPLLVFAAGASIVVLKLLIIAPAVRAFRLNWATGLQTGLLLGPGGEFGFVIVSVAIGENLLTRDTASVLLFVTAMTMATVPLLSKLGTRLAPHLTPKVPVDATFLLPETSDALPRVIIAGFGRVGQTVAAMLERHRVPYVALDSDPTQV